MAQLRRVLDAEPVTTLDAWIALQGGKGLELARSVDPETVLDALGRSGLRGRGGAGFPTATKWRAVRDNRSNDLPTTVVINGAEGEPGSYKDRTILATNPYRVLEGALIAAQIIGADAVVVAMKDTATDALARVRHAITDLATAGWSAGVSIDVVTGPGAYLYGEETALLEVIAGREPFPRIAPPWRAGAEESVPTPALVDNVETLANIAAIVLEGPEWFRTAGTEESPGTLVVTVSGSVAHAGVAEVEMGTTLREVIEHIGGGPRGRSVRAVLPGVSNAVLTADQLDTRLTYEDMVAAGSGLGAGAYLVFDEADDPVAIAQGVSRFLAVESCGQCTPCKQDGVEISVALDRLRRSEPDEDDRATIDAKLTTITDGARCYLATQHQVVVASILAAFTPEVQAHTDRSADPAEPLLIAEIVSIEGTEIELDMAHAAKQPDWTFAEHDSGSAPADRLEQGAHATVPGPSSAPEQPVDPT